MAFVTIWIRFWLSEKMTTDGIRTHARNNHGYTYTGFEVAAVFQRRTSVIRPLCDRSYVLKQCFSTIFFCDPIWCKNPICKNIIATQQSSYKITKKQKFYYTTFIAILLHQFLKSWVAQHHSTLNALDALH